MEHISMTEAQLQCSAALQNLSVNVGPTHIIETFTKVNR